MPTTAPQSPLFVVVLVGICVQTFVPSVPLLLLSGRTLSVRLLSSISLGVECRDGVSLYDSHGIEQCGDISVLWRCLYQLSGVLEPMVCA